MLVDSHFYSHRLRLIGCLAIFAVLPVTCISAEPSNKNAPITPNSLINFLGGQLDDFFYTWMQDSGYEDPHEVFSLKDGMLHVTGNGLGGLITKREYRDYHLIIEFKWGEKTWHGRTNAARDTGVLFHCTGPDGSLHPWMASFEAQIIEGGVGDVLVLSEDASTPGTPIRMTVATESTKDRDGEVVWKKGSERITLSDGRVNWWGRDPDWTDVRGFRGKRDVESPYGEWTRMDVICDGDHFLIQVNGVIVNEGFEARPDHGKILLETELAEFHVRRYELWPLGKVRRIRERKSHYSA